jgi:hypothetical protein
MERRAAEIDDTAAIHGAKEAAGNLERMVGACNTGQRGDEKLGSGWVVIRCGADTSAHNMLILYR